MKHIKAFATQADVATYEQSQQYVEPYIGASYDSVAAHYNHNTPVYKQFYDYDDETHQYNLYEQVEYIENPSNAYIDTGVDGKQLVNVDVTLSLTENVPSNYECWYGFWEDNNTSVKCVQLLFGQNSTLVAASGRNSFSYVGVTANSQLTVNTKYTFSVNQTQTTTSSRTYYIFCRNNDKNNPVRCNKVRIYMFKMYKNNVLVRDFIPVKRINDNVYGLWDCVNGKFYISPNGIQFIGGAKTIYDTNNVQYQQVEYIQNPSTAYINTGIYGTMDLNFYIEFTPTELATAYKSGAGSIFGSRSAYNSRAYQLTTYNKVSPYSASTRGHFLCANNYGWNDNKAPTANMLLNQKNIIKKENLIFTRADGSTFTLTSQTFTTAATITIFQCAGAGEPAKIKLYKLQFSRGGTVLRDYIPVKRISDSKYGLFDCINKQFYTSQTEVDFTGG